MVYQDTHDPGSSLISIIPAALLGVRLVYRDTSDPGSSPIVQVAALLGLVYQATAHRHMAEVILEEVLLFNKYIIVTFFNIF